MKLHEEQIIAQQLPLAPPHPLSTFQELELGVIGLHIQIWSQTFRKIYIFVEEYF